MLKKIYIIIKNLWPDYSMKIMPAICNYKKNNPDQTCYVYRRPYIGKWNVQTERISLDLKSAKKRYKKLKRKAKQK